MSEPVVAAADASTTDVSASMYSLVVGVDPDLITDGDLGPRFAELLESNGSITQSDLQVVVISRDQSVRKGGGKAPAAKNQSKKPNAAPIVTTGNVSTLTPEMTETLKARIATELANKIDELNTAREREAEEAHALATGQLDSKSGKRSGHRKKDTKKRSTHKTESKTSTTPKANDKDAKDAMLNAALAARAIQHPPIPLFIVLLDWIKNIHDVTLLNDHGITLDGMLRLQRQSQANASDELATNVDEFGPPRVKELKKQETKSLVVDLAANRTSPKAKDDTTKLTDALNEDPVAAAAVSSTAAVTAPVVAESPSKKKSRSDDKKLSKSSSRRDAQAAREREAKEKAEAERKEKEASLAAETHVSTYEGVQSLIANDASLHSFGFVDVHVNFTGPPAEDSLVSARGGKGRKDKKESKKESSENESIARVAAMDTRAALHQFAEQRIAFGVWQSKAQVVTLPTALPAEEVDTRLYHNLMSKIPDAYTTIPLMCHCLFEQVAMTVLGGAEETVEEFARESATVLEGYLDDVFANVVGGGADDQAEEAGLKTTEGAPHAFHSGYCVQCGVSEAETSKSGLKGRRSPTTVVSDEKLVTESSSNDETLFFDNNESKQEEDEEVVEAMYYGEDCPGTIGQPHEYENNACVKCGHVSEEHTYNDRVVIPSLDLTATQTKMNTAQNGGGLCPGTMGGGHEFDLELDTKCRNCDAHYGVAGGDEDDFADTVRSDSNPSCPATNGLACLFEGGVCVLCNQQQNTAVVQNVDTLGYCPARIGQEHEIVVNECIHCAQAFGPSLEEDDEDIRTAASSSRPLSSALTACPATIGLECEYVDGECVACGQPEASVNVYEDPATVGQPQQFNDVDVDDAADSDVSVETARSTNPAVIFCPAKIGQAHEYDMDGYCSACGEPDASTIAQMRDEKNVAVIDGVHEVDEARMHDKQEQNDGLSLETSEEEDELFDICPATVKHEGGPADVKAVVLDAPDKESIQQALASLALDIGLVAHPLLDSAARLFKDWWALPGIKRRGMPSKSDKSLVDRGVEQTEMMNASELSPYLFNRALLALNFTEVLAEPGYDFKVSRLDPDFFYHVDYLDRGSEGSVVEAAVKARLVEHANSNKSSSSSNDEKEDEEEVDLTFDWQIGQRRYVEEFSKEALAQVLSRATLSISENLRTEARYSPIDDSLLVAVQNATPLLGQNQRDWQGFVCPNLNFSQWIRAPERVRASAPEYIYKFNSADFSGLLQDENRIMFPADKAQVGHTRSTTGSIVHNRAWILKDDYLLTLERTKPDAVFPLSRTRGDMQDADVSKKEDVNAASRPLTGEAIPNESTQPEKPAETEEEPAVEEKKSRRKKDKDDETNEPVKRDRKKKDKKSKKRDKKDKEPDAKQLALEAEAAAEAQEKRLAALAAAEEQARIEDAIRKEQAEAAAREALVQAAADRAAEVRRLALHTMSVRYDDGNRVTVSGANVGDLTALSVAYTAASGLVVLMDPEASVSMSFPSSLSSPSTDKGPGTKVNEVSRRVTRAGVIVRYMSDGSKQLLQPDGTVCLVTKDANGDEVRTTTSNDGSRTQLHVSSGQVSELQQLQVAVQYDPEGQSEICTREDLVMVIQYGNGSKLIQHADGTRIYVDVFEQEPNRRELLVECPLFFPVKIVENTVHELKQVSAPHLTGIGAKIKGSQLQKSVQTTVSVLPHNGDVLNMAYPYNTGPLTFTRHTGDQFVCCAEGKTVFIPTAPAGSERVIPEELLQGKFDAEAIPKGCYKIDILEGSIGLLDAEGNELDAGANKDNSRLILARHRSQDAKDGRPAKDVPARYYPAPKAPIQPRLFVVRGDGTGYELLAEDAAENFLESVQNQPGVVALPAESLGDMDAEEWERPTSLKFLSAVPDINAYSRVPVMPNVIKAAPRALLNAGEQTMRLVIYRQLIKHPALTSETEQAVYRGREQFRSWKEQQRQEDIDYEVDDPRTEEEKAEEARLAEELVEWHAVQVNKQHDAVAAQQSREADISKKVAQGLTSMTVEAERNAAEQARQDKEYREPVQTFTRDGEDGDVHVLKFFTSSGGKKKKRVAHDRDVDQETARLVQESLRAAEAEAKDGQVGDSFFEDASFNRTFVAHKLLQSMRRRCHPLHALSATKQVEELEKGGVARERELLQVARERVTFMLQGVKDFTRFIGRILTRPSDPTLRAIDLQAHPYRSLVTNTPTLRAFAPYLVTFLGFQPHGGIYVQTKDDLFLQLGLEFISVECDKVAAALAEEQRTVLTEEEAVMLAETDAKEQAEEDLEAEIEALEEDDASQFGDGKYFEPPAEQEVLDIEYQERERRLRKTVGPVTHAKFSSSFKKKPKPMVINATRHSPAKPTEPRRSNKQPKSRLADTNVRGSPRSEKIATPYVLQQSVQPTPNRAYLAKEQSAINPLRTSSTFGRSQAHSSTSWSLVPSSIELGSVQAGQVYRVTATLTNTGGRSGRFRVTQAQDNEAIQTRVLFRPGMVAVGLEKRLEVEVAVLEPVGEFEQTVVVTTEQSTFVLPVRGVATSEGREAKRSSKRFGRTGQVRVHR